MIMKRYNLLIGLGLLSAASLSSCKEEVFDKNNNTFYGEELKLYTAEAGLETFETNDAGKSSRANVESDGKSFLWNTGDAVSIWDGATGNFKFTASEDYNDEVNPQNKIAFAGNAALTDGAKVWGVYPYTEVEGTFTDKNVRLTLPETVTISETNKPALQETMFMIAEGEVAGDKIEKLNFKHLTGIFQFNITNTESEAKTFSSVSIKASTPIFPTVVTGTLGDDNQMSYAYTEGKDVLSGQFGEITLEEGQSVSVYMNFLPTQLSDETELTFSVGNTEVLKGTVAELYNSSSSIISAGYEAGKRYIINLKTEERYPDEGYRQEGDEYIVYDAKGLKAVLEIPEAITSGKTIKLNRGIDFAGAELTPVENFAATLDGQNNVISNFTIPSSRFETTIPAENPENPPILVTVYKTGLVLTNAGIIKNLKIDKVILKNKSDVILLGVLAASNNGTIENCEISNTTISIQSCIQTGASVGFIAGENAGNIRNVSLASSSIDVTGGKVNFGGIVGKNTSNVVGSSVKKNVDLTYNSDANNSQFAGVVGWNVVGGKVDGCSSAATISPNKASHFGGVVGSNSSNSSGGKAYVIASYCCGEISAIASGSNTGGVVATNAGEMIGCYSSVANAGDFGGLCGTANGTITNCYFYNCTNGKRVGKGSVDVSGMKVDNANALKGNITTLNAAISSSSFHYIPNNDDKEPLRLESR